MGKPTTPKPGRSPFDVWLEENAQFGIQKLADATSLSYVHMVRLLARAGVSVTAVKKAHGLKARKNAPGKPPSPPERPSTPKRATNQRLSEDPAARDLEKQLAAAKAEATSLRKERQILLADQGRQQGFFEAVLAAIPKVEPTRQLYTKALQVTPTMPSATLLLGIGDWHTGEVVSREQTAGWGHYNWKIQQSRIALFTAASLDYLETLRHGYVINNAVIFYFGDGVSGDIHHELSVTNEWPAPEQALRGGLLLAEQVAAFAPHFQTVRLIYITQSNHGRLTRKPRYKAAGVDSHDFSMAHFARMALSNHSNVEVDIRTEVKALVEVDGWKFLLEHGDAYQSWMQIPHYGIQRGIRSEAWRRMGHEGAEFDYLVMGHWHFPFSLEGGKVLGVGSPKGTCEFTLKKSFVTTASQSAWLIGKHGIFARTDFDLEETQ